MDKVYESERENVVAILAHICAHPLKNPANQLQMVRACALYIESDRCGILGPMARANIRHRINRILSEYTANE